MAALSSGLGKVAEGMLDKGTQLRARRLAIEKMKGRREATKLGRQTKSNWIGSAIGG